MIRLFAGIDFPEHIQEQLYSLRGGVPGASWKPKENLHITLRFIGNVDEADADYIHEGFMQIRAPAFNLQMTQVGFFATGSQMRHLWTGVNYYQPLDFLHDKIENVLNRYKIPLDKHKFHAHATLATLRGTTPEDVQKFIEYNNLFKSDEFYVDHFNLYSSHKKTRGEEGSYYKIEAQYPLFGFYE
ncbi:MAG: RNA 2',3'-cyclic phosphodiesterase [Alphaproteobacteria bacterium]|nr:RNA 2',3'-cyclic phosphodiesterase [Alphaproteobacteria bacterium]